MEVARDMLIKTVNEFNNIMGLTPKIPDTLDDVLLTKAIEKASTLIDPKDDFSDAKITKRPRINTGCLSFYLDRRTSRTRMIIWSWSGLS